MTMSSIKKRPSSPFNLLSLVVSASALPMLAARQAALEGAWEKIRQLFRTLYFAPIRVLGARPSPFFFSGHFYSFMSREPAYARSADSINTSFTTCFRAQIKPVCQERKPRLAYCHNIIPRRTKKNSA
jgi:hypothetical protein